MGATLLSLAMAAELDALIDVWLQEEFEESPVRASQLGVDGYDDRLGDYSAAGFARRDARDTYWLAAIRGRRGVDRPRPCAFDPAGPRRHA